MFLKDYTSEIISNFAMGLIYTGAGLFILIQGKFLEFNILHKIVFGLVLLIYGLFRLYRAIKLNTEEKTVNEDKYEDRMNNKITLLVLILTSFVLIKCNSNGYSDTPTTGSLIISVDETFKPLIDSEIDTFEKIYRYADVKAVYKPENEAFNDLFNDSIKLIIVSRSLNKEEEKIFEKWEIVPKVIKIAYDAIAFIGSKYLIDSSLTLREISDLLSGNSRKYKDIKIVFDNNNSSTINYLMEKTGVKILGSNCFAANSNRAVIDYISNEKKSIGIIGVNWISDRDDTLNINFLKSVKVFRISVDDSSETLKPYQGYIALKTYPLWREVYIISKEAYTGLGTGFTSFVASEKGQRIVLKFGLVPATMPVRLVELIEDEELFIKE